MFPDFTPALTHALDHARAYAFRQGMDQVEPVHLFRAFLREMEGRAAQALQFAGLDLQAAARELELPATAAILDAGAGSTPLGRQCEAILETARELARDLSEDRLVTSDQALLALLQHEPDLSARLADLGLSVERLRDRIAPEPLPLRLEEPLLLAEPVERTQAGRIIDAAGNRAREALRVVEDYCRFVLDDAFLSRELKELRHKLAEILSNVPVMRLMEARETLQDVGVDLTTPREGERYSLLDVAQAGLKRLEEALRSLEEFGKLFGPDFGVALEKLRYRAYTLEKAVFLGTAARQRLADARLYVLVTGSQCLAALDWTIREAAEGGAQVFQLREKNLSDRELLERARNVRRWTRETHTLFIVNDRPDIARLVEADGTHLGQDDMTVKDARQILGPDGLIGVSTHSLEQARQAVLEGASYIGAGPTFPSETKAFAELAGIEYVKEVTAETTLPTFVIGGVGPKTLPAAIAGGACRAAVSQAICRADDPRAAAAQLRRMLSRDVV